VCWYYSSNRQEQRTAPDRSISFFIVMFFIFIFGSFLYELKFENVFSAAWFVKLIEFYIAWSLSFFIWWYLLNSFLFLKFHHPFWDYIFVDLLFTLVFQEKQSVNIWFLRVVYLPLLWYLYAAFLFFSGWLFRSLEFDLFVGFNFGVCSYFNDLGVECKLALCV
jgi:hypothetical protein